MVHATSFELVSSTKPSCSYCSDVVYEGGNFIYVTSDAVHDYAQGVLDRINK